ncbi:MAG: hypothetical protein GEU75_06630 [Dehalococcoidia bacterium]|nr:hypothetical protein [Dehalococcoidia bacterium]
MSESDPPEFHFGLPEEIEGALTSAIDDWDDWQLETLVIEAAFIYEDRQAAAGAGPDTEAVSATLVFLAEEMTWGIDEPLTASGFAFLDDGWP